MTLISWPTLAFSINRRAHEYRSPDAMTSSIALSFVLAASMSASACAARATIFLAFSNLSIAFSSLVWLAPICSRRVLMTPNHRPATIATAPIDTRISLSRFSLESLIILTCFFRVSAFERERNETSCRIARVGLFRRNDHQLCFLQIGFKLRVIVDRSLQLENLVARTFGRVLGVDRKHYSFPRSGRSPAADNAHGIGGRFDAF